MGASPVRIGHSPDPDDAFLFYALTHGKLELPGFTITHLLEGIEQLNQRALSGELEMTAISLAAYPYCADRYLLLPTGASVGDRVGPIVVAKEEISLEALQKVPVAVPGRLTTAALLLQLAVGSVQPEILPFDQILPAVKEGRVAAGVLIHEGQLTYPEWGLKKILDLGEWWWQKTRLPVPLGVNVIRRDLGGTLIDRLNQAFRESLEYAFAHREEALQYALKFGRGLDRDRADLFIGMYVNRFSLDARSEAAAAMQRLLDWGSEAGFVPHRVPIEFV